MTTNVEPIWVDPPPQGSTGIAKWVAVLTPLIAKPNRWAMVGSYDTQRIALDRASDLRTEGVIRPPGNWEFRAVAGNLYARFLGEEEATDEFPVVWEDPPYVQEYNPRPGPESLWYQRLLPVMERPGQWAMVKEAKITSAKSLVGQLRRRILLVPDAEGQWEFVSTQSKEDGNRRIYARYLGPKEEDR